MGATNLRLIAVAALQQRQNHRKLSGVEMTCVDSGGLRRDGPELYGDYDV